MEKKKQQKKTLLWASFSGRFPLQPSWKDEASQGRQLAQALPRGLRRGSWRQCVCPSLTLLWAQQRARAHPWECPLLASQGCCASPGIAQPGRGPWAGLVSAHSYPQRLTCWSHGGHAAPVMMEGKTSAGPRGCCRPCRVLLTPRMPVELTQFAVSCFPANIHLQK